MSDKRTRAPHRPRPIPRSANTMSMSGERPETAKHEEEKAAGDYEVGYGKPPQKTQFKKGQSGNPNGRPKDALSFDTHIRRSAAKKTSVMLGGTTVQMTRLNVVAEQVMTKAMKGDAKAAALVREICSDEAVNQPLTESLISAENRERIRRFLNSAEDSEGEDA